MEPLLRRTLGEDVDLVVIPCPEVGMVEMDIHQFEQVLLNLAINARDAMPAGGRLTLETGNVELDAEYCRYHQEISPGAYAMLAVTDTGTGIGGATVERIFEPFFTTKAPGEGTGLGLATVYGTVKQSGGSISVYSELGKGTCFKIYLPSVATPENAENGRASTAADVQTTRGNETILLVEDEETLRNLARRVLGNLGYRVLGAASAAEAWEVLGESGHIDMLLTDLVLPGGVQGCELATRMLSQVPGMRVLYMSGYTRNSVVHAGRLDKGVCFIEKPFTPDGLAKAVRCVLDLGQLPG